MSSNFFKQFTFIRYIRGLNAFAALVHATNVVLLGVFHFQYLIPLTYTKTTFANAETKLNKITDVAFSTTTVFTTVNPVTLFMVNESIALFSALIGAFNTVRSTESKIIYYETRRRWIEFGITAAFLEVGVLLCLGETDLFSLISFFLLILFQQVFGFLIDTESKEKSHHAKIHLFLYFFMAFFILFYQQTFVILKALSSTGLSDRDRIVLPVVNALMYTLFGLHHYLSVSGNKFYKYYVNKDTQFIILSFCTKTIVTWLTFISLRHTVETIDNNYTDYSIDWENGFYIVLMTVIPFFIVSSIWLMTARPIKESSEDGATNAAPLITTPESDEKSTKISFLTMGEGEPVLGVDFYETDRLL